MEVNVENIIKTYNNKKILNVESLLIEKGSICAIVGQNGSGKTTLVKIIAGLLKQTSGNIYYNNQTAPCFNDITLVFQNPYLFQTTVEKNILYPLKIRKWDKKEANKRASELIEQLNLSGQVKQKAQKLSGGEAQKVALARALSFYPKLLLLDEPTSNIDIETTQIIENMLKDFNNKHNTTIVVITHSLEQAHRLCNKIITLNNGEIESINIIEQKQQKEALRR